MSYLVVTYIAFRIEGAYKRTVTASVVEYTPDTSPPISEEIRRLAVLCEGATGNLITYKIEPMTEPIYVYPDTRELHVSIGKIELESGNTLTKL